MKKRGISPVIATILLVAMVIVMAMIIFLWFKGMTEESITKFDDENIKLVCEKVVLDVDYGSDILTIINNGNVPIINVKLMIFENGEHRTEELSNWYSTGLNQGRIFSEDISGDVDLSLAEKLKVIPVLMGNSNSGQQTYVCDEKDGFEVSL